MTVHRYRFGGLTFASAIALPEWAAFGEPATCHDPDVSIEVEHESLPLPDPLPAATIARDEYTMHARRAGRFRALGGRRIALALAPDAEDAIVRLFLLGSVLGALFHQRGLLALHASVVRTSGRTIAFCGPMGAGKSSMAAALIARGARFVCDDLARFDAGPPAVVYPSTPRLKLWQPTLDTLSWPANALARDHSRREKFHVPQAHVDPWSPVPLDAICLLEWGDAGPRATRLSGSAALRQLVAAATYRADLLQPMNQFAAHCQRCVSLAAGVPVFHFVRPHDWRALDASIDLVTRL